MRGGTNSPTCCSQWGMGSTLHSPVLSAFVGIRGQGQRSWLYQSRKPEMTSNSSSSPESTLALGDNQATYLCLLPFSLASSHMPLSIEYETFCLSLTTPYHISSHSNGTHLAAIAKYQVSPNFLRGACGRQPQICVWVSLSHSICQHAGLGHASLSQRDPYSAKGTGQALS